MKLRATLKVFLLAFLLLSLQLEARVHPLGHLGDRMRAAAEHGAVASAAHSPCAECDLLAGGIDVPTSGHDVPGLPSDATPAIVLPAAGTVAAIHLPYRSRAPPVLR